MDCNFEWCYAWAALTLQVISDSISLGNCGGGEEASDTACGGPLPPLYDQAWYEQYQRMEAFNRQMVRSRD